MIIHETLNFILGRINPYLKKQMGSDDEKVKLSGLVKQNSELAVLESETALMLINIEEEKIGKTPVAYKNNGNGLSPINPDIKLNLHILFASPGVGDINYAESLKMISHVVGYFQGINVFTPKNSPDLPEGIEKLILELRTLSLEEQNHLWGFTGAKYVPSVIYKVRMLIVDGSWPLGSGQVIENVNIIPAQS